MPLQQLGEKITDSLNSIGKGIEKGAKGTVAGATKVTKGTVAGATKVTKTVASGTKSVATGAAKGATSVTKRVSKTASSGVSTASSRVSNALKKDSDRMTMSKLTESSEFMEADEKEPETAVMIALMEHRVTASVKDMDFYRKDGFLVVKTDYIVHVKATKADGGDPDFGFIISKPYAHYRALVNELYRYAEDVMFSDKQQPHKVAHLAKYCHAAFRLIESEEQEFIGKLNYNYVQHMAKQRSQIINDFLSATMTNFPDSSSIARHLFCHKVATAIETFFLTDHCQTIEGEELQEDVWGTLVNNPIKKHYQQVDGCRTLIVAQSTKERKSKETRDCEEKELSKAGSLQIDEDDKQKAAKAPSSKKKAAGSSHLQFMDENPILAVAAFAGLSQVLRAFGLPAVTLNIDMILVLAFASFCLGMQSPKLMAKKKKKASAGLKDSRTDLMKKSMRASMRGAGLVEPLEDEEEEEEEMTLPSPMPRFPEGAALGSVFNCWSDPPNDNFKVRGGKYLADRKKVPSGPFLFPSRGLDLFLTDQCPENVGRITSLLNDELRSVPTFMINFRLPWGVLIFYFEIPERFVPFVKGCYGDESVNKDELDAKIKEMSNPDRCVARFLLGNDEHKNNTLKIFPGIVEGPWMVKATVGGKPAIIGTKLPVNYVYQPEGVAVDGSKQALYLEADLDICSSSAARSILSVCRSGAKDLTIDLGFGVQGNSNDELPEQMLTGTRIHGIDPVAAPPLPPMADMLFATDDADADDDDMDETAN